ncbi:hypothetical protein, partial [Streptomyces sp. UNOC14_S4]|uniref:hypothetical protein n=1 Tax=Streptomyces sp. UNOC14_S4 TaxID=2872340 RepID=UPI001E419DAD
QVPRHLSWVGGAINVASTLPRVPKWIPALGEFAVDTSTCTPVTGEVRGWDGEEVILRVPGEEKPRRTKHFRRAKVSEELSAKNALANRRRWPR